MRLKPSDRRAIRTAYQAGIALVIFIPIALEAFPGLSTTAAAVTLSAWIVVISKTINALEDAGVIPQWLKDEDSN